MKFNFLVHPKLTVSERLSSVSFNNRIRRDIIPGSFRLLVAYFLAGYKERTCAENYDK